MESLLGNSGTEEFEMDKNPQGSNANYCRDQDESTSTMAYASDSVLSMPALGRPFALGTLYDARRDSLVPGLTLWNNDQLSNEVMRHRRNRQQTFEVHHKDTIRDRCSKFDMNIGLKLSFLGGLVNVGGSAAFLNEGRAGSTYDRVTGHFSTVTHFEGLTMDHLDTENISFPAVLSGNHATHVCVGIEYGAKAVLMFETAKTSNPENKKTKGNLNASVSRLASLVDTDDKGNCELSENEKIHLENVSVKYYGDVKLDKAPTSFDDAADALQNIVAKVDEKSAVALKVHLLPLSTFSKSATKVVDLVHDAVFDDLEEVLYEIHSAEQAVKTMLENEVFKAYPELSAFLGDCHSHLKAKEIRFRTAVSRELVRYRSAETSDLSTFASLLNNIYGSFFDPSYLSTWIDDQKCRLQLLHELLVQMQTVEKNAAGFKLFRRMSKHCVVFSVKVGFQNFKEQVANVSIDARTFNDVSCEFRELFQQFKDFVSSNSNNENAASFVVIPDIRKSSTSGNIAGNITYYNLRNETKNFIPPSAPRNVVFTEVSSATATFQWDPPKDGCEHITAYEVRYWGVSNRDRLHTEKANNVQIRASKSDDTNFKIENLEPTTWYGAKVRSLCKAGWSSWSPAVEVQTTLKLREEYNILLMGATGVGKSTFINAFVHYLRYQTLEDAKEGGVVHVIPSCFTLTIDGEMHTVKIGDEQGSVEATAAASQGGSCTQRPKSYIVPVETPTVSYVLRLIDTPGIGDTRGIQQDKENVRSILHYINHIDELHGILFLMKPNDARLTVALKYCIKELLRHLHRSAADILLFVFTNSRSTFYEPGDSLQPLRHLLKNIRAKNGVNIQTNADTMFCVDSESFRYLAAIDNNIQLNAANDDDFRVSWEKSSIACRKLVHKIKTLEAHRTKETTTLNEIRHIILQSAKPLSEISTLIQGRLHQVRTEKKLIQDYKGNIDELKGKLNVNIQVLVSEALEKPRTVCTHKECTVVEQVDGSSYQKVPVSICHDNCSLQGIPIKCVGDPTLVSCYAMKTDNGKQSATCHCGHSYKHHCHENVKYIRQTKEAVDCTVEQEMSNEQSKVDRRQSMTEKLENEQAELRAEQYQVIKIMAKFAHFLNHNGILSVNDSMVDYIEYQIREQEDIKANLTSDDPSNQAIIDGLHQSLADFESERAILEGAFAGQTGVENGGAYENGGTLQIEDMEEAIKMLKNLPHVGETFRLALAEEYKAVMKTYEFETYRVPRQLSRLRANHRTQNHGMQRNSAAILPGCPHSVVHKVQSWLKW